MSAKKPIRLRPVLTGFALFVRQEAFGGVLLLAAVAAALWWANSSAAAGYEQLWQTPLAIALGPWQLSMPIHDWINDGLMAVFFFVVGLEIKRELLVGELSRPRQALFPVAAAVGGMLAPALIYLAFNAGGAGQPGWGIPVATDIAFALGVLALLGKRVPVSLKIFLTAVAIVDDIGAVLVIAVFYSHGLAWGALLFSAAVLLLLVLLNRAEVDNPIPYALVGIALWLGLLHSGIHATVAGVLLAACIPTFQRIDGRKFVERARGYLAAFEKADNGGILGNREQQQALEALETATDHVASPLQQLEHGLHPWVTYLVMPVFAFANAGVSLGGGLGGLIAHPVSLGVMLGLVLGKQAGILLAPLALARLGWVQKPRGLTWRQIYGAAWLGGIGFTMSLFVTHLAFGESELAHMAKLGVLGASVLAALGGSVVLLAGAKE
jgi:NhaA family Na+:H+ antiporter